MPSDAEALPARWTPVIRAGLDDPACKRALTEQLFTVIAPRYDFITRALSFGRDRAWKRVLLAALPAGDEAPRCLDLACGTGDLAGGLAARFPRGCVLGIDVTESMLSIARARHPHANLNFAQQDMNRLEAADASVDIVTGGYALRNAPHIEAALAEVRRVLRPGGTAAFLEFSKPASRSGQRLVLALLRLWGGFWGLVLHGDPGVYAYIAYSLERFPDRLALRECFRVRGFAVRVERQFCGGIVVLTVLEKAKWENPKPQIGTNGDS